jgi:redox-sensitive bicupin YhaK (pirin superfamily)
VAHQIAKGRCVWVQLASGTIEINKVPLVNGDGAAVIEDPFIEINAIVESEFLLFDLVQ